MLTSVLDAMFRYVVPSLLNCHLSVVSFQRSSTLFEVPRLISMPASADGEPVTLELSRILLSSTAKVSVLRVVVLPCTVRLPETVRS